MTLLSFLFLLGPLNLVFIYADDFFCFLHPANCPDADISRKKSQHVASALSLGGQVLKIAYKYLGFYLSADLSWSYHNIHCICTKARKIMGILYWQFSSNVDSLAMNRLYTSLVRPHLEYGVEVWNTYLQKDIAALENVRNFYPKSLL